MYNPYIVIPFTAWIIAQTIKFCLAAWRGRVDFKLLYGSGGMPSGHSALVSALAMTAFLTEGFASPLFGVTAVLAAIVMYDSFGVRRSSGEQAAALNVLIARQISDRQRSDQPGLHRLREVLGHSPFEVAVGALIGVALAVLFNLDKVTSVLEFLATIPKGLELIVYACLFGLLIVGGVVTRLVLGWRYRKSVAIKTLAKQILVKSQTIGWTGAMIVFAQYERVAYLAWRFWPLILIAGMLVWDGYLVRRFSRSLPKALEEERQQERRLKWLKPRGKGKKARQ